MYVCMYVCMDTCLIDCGDLKTKKTKVWVSFKHYGDQKQNINYINYIKGELYPKNDLFLNES